MQAHIAKIEPSQEDKGLGRNSLVIYFAGCSFNCPYCNTPEMLHTKEEFLVDLKEVKKQIKENLAHIDSVIFTGGEPTLQRQALLNLAAFCKERNLKTGIETNGSKPECLRTLLSLELLDFAALDIKAPFVNEIFQKATRSSTFFITTDAVINDITRTIQLLKKNTDKLDVEIRTTLVPGLMYRKEDLMKIGMQIEPLGCRWLLQRFSPENVASKIYSELNPPSVSFLEDLRDAIHRKFPNLRVDVV